MIVALGIDTSLYKTSCAVADDRGRVVHAVSMPLPVAHGALGLRQNDAVFLHVQQLPDALSEVLSYARKARFAGIAVSARPVDTPDSYMPVFLAGVSLASSLSLAWDVPLIKTTHQQGHLRAARIGNPDLPQRFLAVHLSGGTTDVMLHETDNSLRLLFRGLDLHAGQLVDRVGVALGFPFPAGAALDSLAQDGNTDGRYPVSVRDNGFHLSGAETAALADVQRGNVSPADIAANVLDVIARSLLRVLKSAADASGVRDVLIFGGVASSKWLRTSMQERNRKRRLELTLHFGLPEYSGDNAAGVALLALHHTTYDDRGERNDG